MIASRPSALARAQAEMIGEALRRLHPRARVEFRWIETEGDQRADVSLADAGGKGLFAKAVEQALLEKRADIAVHSLKDLPTKLTRGLIIAAVPKREDPRDCLVSRNGEKSIEELPGGAIVGTASPRRAAQVKRIRPDLRIELMRGNVQTRLRKVVQNTPLDSPMYEATLLAAAGLIRAGLERHTEHIVEPDVMLPAAGQGALALQCRGDDHTTIRRLLPLNDPTASQAVEFERAIVHGLRGDCHSPIAALAEPMTIDGKPGFRLRARVLSPDGQRCAEAMEEATGKATRRLAKRVLEKLCDQGAAEILANESN